MAWWSENWSFLVVVACALGIAFLWVKKFSKLPTEEQMEKIREWLLFAVIEAEKEYQSGTGRLKLVATYSRFCEVFPSLVTVISLETFSCLVDEALDEMRKILATNKDIAAYVEEN